MIKNFKSLNLNLVSSLNLTNLIILSFAYSSSSRDLSKASSRHKLNKNSSEMTFMANLVVLAHITPIQNLRKIL